MTFRTASANAAGAGGSVTVTKPAGVVAGDLLVAFTNFRGLQFAPLTAPGWTQIGATIIDGGNQVTCEVWAKVATGAEPANYTFSITAPSEAQSGAVVIVRDDTPVPIASVNGGRSTAGGGGATTTAPTLTPTRGPNTLYAAWADQGEGSSFTTGALTPTGGYAAAAAATTNVAPSSGGSSIGVGYKAGSGSASGASSISTGLGVNWGSFTQAILMPAALSFAGEPGGGVW